MPGGGDLRVGGIYADLQLDTSDVPRALAKVESALKKTESEIEKLQHRFQTSGGDLKEFEDYLDRLIQTKQALVAKSAELRASLGRTDAATKKADESAKQLARGLVQLGYIVDDVRYGFGAVVNNIGPLVQAFGGSAGLAGGAQIAAVALYELYTHWDKVKAELGDDSGIREAMRTLEGLKERIKDLKDEMAGIPRPGIAALLDVTEGMAAREGKAAKAADSMMAAETDEQKARRERVEQAVKEHGGLPGLSRKMGDFMFEQGHYSQFLNDEDTRRLAGIEQARREGHDLPEYTREVEKSLREKARRNARQQAQRYFGRAATDADTGAALAEDLKKNRGLFGDLGDVIAGDKQTDQERNKANDDDQAKSAARLAKTLREREAAEKRDQAAIDKANDDDQAKSAARLKARKDREERHRKELPRLALLKNSVPMKNRPS
jgi:hypothetical protein